MVIEAKYITKSVAETKIDAILLMSWGKSKDYHLASYILAEAGYHMKTEVIQNAKEAALDFDGLPSTQERSEGTLFTSPEVCYLYIYFKLQQNCLVYCLHTIANEPLHDS